MFTKVPPNGGWGWIIVVASALNGVSNRKYNILSEYTKCVKISQHLSKYQNPCSRIKTDLDKNFIAINHSDYTRIRIDI